MRAIICISAEEFIELNRRIHEGVIADGGIEERWAHPIKHPEISQVAIPIEERVVKYLTADELHRIVELPEDWFPKHEEEV